ncbi:MAG: DUF4340 domain-containing protein [Clostridiaceae bacterium]|jgi:hypothetical protein|nr:DUF4340 domain-containing protein [Clostridiaceae bacterium]
MKNWKKIIILSVIFVVFLAAFIFLKGNLSKTDNGIESPSPTDVASSDEIKLIDITQEDISKIVLKREDGEIVLTKEERYVETLETNDDGTTKKVTEKKKVWVNPSFDVDNDLVEDVVSAAATVMTKRLIDENPGDLTIYGLDKTLITTFVSTNGKEVSIEIGNLTPTQDSYYVRILDMPAVYTIDSYKGKTLRYGKFDLMNKNLYGTDALSAEDITSLSFKRSGEEVFSAEKRTSSADWVITGPIPEREANISEFSKFLNWVSSFRVKEFVEENPSDLKHYGLDSPKYVFEYTLDGEMYRVMLGNKNDSEYYGMMEGNNTVFSVDAINLNFVDLPLKDLVSLFAYIPLIYDVEKLVIEIDGRTDVLLINESQEEGTTPEFHFNGQKIENDEQEKRFRKYYQGAISIMGDKIDLDSVPSGEAAIRLTYTMKKAEPDKIVKVELIPTNDGYGYFIVRNDNYTGLVIGERKLHDESDTGIRKAYENLVDALAKTE